MQCPPLAGSVRRLLAAALVTLAAAGCSDERKSTAPAVPTAAAAPAPQQLPRSNQLDSARAPHLIEKGALVLDVREEVEWNGGHLAQAKLMPLGTIEQRVAEIEQLAGGKDRPIVVYCRTGSRSAQAKRLLEAAGFTGVVNGGSYRSLSAIVPPAS